MRICLDTNVLLSGIFWGGLPGKILDLWATGEFELLVSSPILNEYKNVLRRLGKKLGPEITEHWITKIVENVCIITTLPKMKGWSRDPSDNMFIHCALSGNADYLVSGDKDLLILKDTCPVPIVSPKEFLKEIK